MSSFAQYGPGKEEFPVNVGRGILRRNTTNDGWEQKSPETILNDAASSIDINGQKIVNVASPSPGSSDAATTSYADSVGVSSVLRAAYTLITETQTTGTSEPLSLADALFVGQSPGGSIAGSGILGVVAPSFASAAAETGTGTGQGGLGSTPAITQPYNPTDFPGQHGVTVQVATSDGTLAQVSDVLSPIPVGQDAQEVYGVLSYRSDLGANLKWRLWFYYRRTSDGFPVSFTPTTSLTNVSLYVAIVGTLATVPIAFGLGKVSSTAAASGVVPGLLSDVQDVGTTDAAGTTGRFSDAAHVHSHGQQPAGSQGGLAHNLADGSNNGFMSSAEFTKLSGLPASAVPTTTTVGAGSGLTGGGTLSGNITLNAVANADGSIIINPDDIQVGILATDAQHGTRGGGTIHAAVTQSVNGFMISTDKAKLDNIAGDTFNVTTTTTNATPFDITAYTPSDLHAVTLSVLITARKSDGTASGSFKLFGGFRRAGGTVTQVGTTKVEATVADTGFTVDATFTITGTAVNINVTGVVGTTIAWRAQGSVVIAP
jgi:hypothetical protein